LAKYETTVKPDTILARYFNIPPHIFPPGFDAKKDSLHFDWKDENSLFEKVKKRANSKEH
jgi:hypothetical protein